MRTDNDAVYFLDPVGSDFGGDGSMAAVGGGNDDRARNDIHRMKADREIPAVRLVSE